MKKSDLTQKEIEERRKKKELRSAIDFLENLLMKLKKMQLNNLTEKEIDQGISYLKNIVKAIRGYHDGVIGLLSSFDVLYRNLEDLKTPKTGKK